MTHPEWKWDGRVAVMSGTQLIAVIGTDGGAEAIAERARLVEVAPRLLEALEEAYALAIGHAATYQGQHQLAEMHPTHRAILEKARAAIAAATNKEV